jgi:hypothetical protein
MMRERERTDFVYYDLLCEDDCLVGKLLFQ